jgi:hypothetical protein
MRFRSFSFVFVPPSHLAVRSIASALFIAAVPSVLRSSNRRAAGVRLPAASERRGVHEGGGILPFPLVPLIPPPGVLAMIPGVRPSCPSPSSPALARKLFEALWESLWEMDSREETAGMWNGVLGVANSTVSSDLDMMRGVALSVPQVISCFTAAGPSSAAVGEGRSGTSEKLVGDLGRSEMEGHYGKSNFNCRNTYKKFQL